MLLAASLALALWLYLLLGRGAFWQVDIPSLSYQGEGQGGGRPVTGIIREADPHLNPPPKEGGGDPRNWPDLCIIVPARNEADMLDQAFPSLLANDYPGKFHIILVDDRSEDGTSATAEKIAQQLQARKRLSIVGGYPRQGWKGKVAAMQRGLEHLETTGYKPRYVLFTDADIRYDPGALTKLVAHSEAEELALDSLMVKLRCQSKAERWLIPAFVYFFALLYPFRWVSNPQKAMAAAAGGCMLTRYDALLKSGGMEPIRAALIDDCAMGRMMKRQGPISLRLTQDVHSLRAYSEFGDIRAMVARSAYDQLGYSPLNLMGAILGMIFTYLVPVLFTLFGHGAVQLLGLASWACMSASFLPMQRFYGCAAWRCLTLPIIAVIYMGFTFDSAIAFARGKGGVWKGRIQASNA